MRKAVVLDKSGTIIKPCRVLLNLASAKYVLCGNTLRYAQRKRETLVNVRGPLASILKGRTKGLSLKVSYCPLQKSPPIGGEILEWEGIMDALAAVAKKVLTTCDTQLGVCTALLINEDCKVTDAVGLGGRLYQEVEQVVRSLLAEGSDVFLATGNCRDSAIKCAKILGIPKAFVLADADPNEKRDLVGRLRGFYGLVVMVGNDINDLTAMEEADLAIMVSRSGEGHKEDEDGGVPLKDEVDYVVPSLLEVEKILSEIR